ncbi:MAG: COX15/CtaA family protein [Candidatus Latescibacterota bacterium]
MPAHRPISVWLFVVSLLVVVMIVFGGWVRLTGSGLSIVRWDVVTGIVPPLGEEAWARAFAAYQQTPEYLHVNAGMGLDEFRSIYYMEYAHRVLGRLAGLAFVLPLLVFVARGAIPRNRLLPFLGIAALFAAQGVLGWLMVQSGLVDQPRVSHLRLTGHLGTALLLLAACLWLGLGYAFGPRPAEQARSSGPMRALAALFLAAAVLQILAGGLLAGLHAGLISDTFPRMFGEWVPDGMWNLRPWMANHLHNPATVHFQHRWFAFLVLGVAVAVALRGGREALPAPLRAAARGAMHLTAFQVLVGVGLVAMHVPAWMASLHQAVAIAILIDAVFVCHRAYA